MVNLTETEFDFVTKVCTRLNEFMHIEREAWSDCKKGRIDVIAECKLTATRFGIECKRSDKKRGEGLGEFMRQGVRYSQMTFGGSPIPIFMAPPLSNNYLALVDKRVTIDNVEYILDRHKPDNDHHTVNGLLGDFNVGELRKFYFNNKDYAKFIFSNKEIYSFKPKWDNINRQFGPDITGLHQENYAKLMRKIKAWRL